jgi:transcriptional regulator with XRE-family HTH domain
MISVKEIKKNHIFNNKSLRQIGQDLGVSKQYLSFICAQKKNQPELINRQLLIEFERDKDKYPIHEKIRIKRKLLNYTQAYVANKVGTFASVVTRIEAGQMPTSIFVQRLADYLEV